ncbi:MAG: YggS family pyridoxal phosphate-dependent enzyme [Schwartzia sp.]|nr:YggS family pyridoxal phosphate-dependent enzyme [Schwartzia sp. (in: firmicutes)]MBQ2047942.1 YggS family pyridoxal phosphate-dependent enzyme [Schwartzia sp. (in: firmicutes)]MBQ3863016.1 YggS family pyridoxal phosphate-dependent enzyme [Schwartzia sp. (in: firmicutes)]
MIAEHLETVKKNIEESMAKRTGIFKDDPVQLVAVTKNHDVEAMREAIDAGVTVVGENRVQEAVEKHEKLDRDVIWHLIGHLQTNKVKQAVKNFDLIHSVDSEHLLDAVDTAAGKIHKVQNILIQVNLAKEESKFGIYKEDLPFLLQKADQMKHVHLMGLMCIAPNYENVEECRPLFREMRGIFDKLQMFPLMNSEMKWLSMGMTHDYQIAIEEGSNLVRIGTAIFGPRQY